MNQQKPLKFYENRPIINMEARFPPNFYQNDQGQFSQDFQKKHNYQEKVYSKNNDYINQSYDMNRMSAAPQNQQNFNTQSNFNFKTQPADNSNFTPFYLSTPQANQARGGFENNDRQQQQKQRLNTDYPDVNVRQPANPKGQSSPNKIFNSNAPKQTESKFFLTPVNQVQSKIIASPANLSATNKEGHKPIFVNSNIITQSQAFNDAEISEIRSYNQDNEQVKHSKKYYVPTIDYQNEDNKVKRSRNVNNNNNSSQFVSPAKSINNKRIFGEGNDDLNKSASYIKNVELLNSEERIKKSKIFNPDLNNYQSVQLGSQGRLSYIENSQSQVHDKYARERALKEQELKKLTLEQAFCQNCFEFIHYETTDVVDRHTQFCKTIEESAKIQTHQFIQKERDLHNSFIDETDNREIERQQRIQIINSKLEKLRYLLIKMLNVLQESDFLKAKPELNSYNIIEIKKSLERISTQDVDCKFIQSCLNNIENQTKDIDLIQHIYCTPESTQFLQIIKTIPEIVYKKMEFIQNVQQPQQQYQQQQQQQQQFQYQYQQF